MIVRGQEVRLPGVQLKTWHETGLTFPGLGRRTETRAVVLHWTGGEGGGLDGGKQEQRVIRERRLSVHFCVEQDGGVYQYVDTDARCAHAGEANAWSVGIEISNRANGKPSLTPGGKWPREVYLERVHGKSFKCCAFYPAQLAAVEALTRGLCTAYGLPYEVPDLDTALPRAALREWRGVLGHYHITRRKLDPGTRLWREINLRTA